MTTPRIDQDALALVYGAGADPYDEIWSPVIRPPAASVINDLDMSTGACVLDVGAGTGALTSALAAAAPNGFLASIDPSEAMLCYARERRGVIAILADAAALPCASARVDAVLLAYVLFHLLDPTRALIEAKRVLRPGGRVGTVTWANENWGRANAVWDEALEELGVPALPAHGNHTGLDSEAAITTLLRSAELTPLRVWREAVDCRFQPEQFWQMRVGCGSNRARIDALPAPSRARFLRETHERLARLDPGTDYGFHGELVCAVGEK
jgi:SAM-dependent methyltransferase